MGRGEKKKRKWKRYRRCRLARTHAILPIVRFVRAGFVQSYVSETNDNTRTTSLMNLCFLFFIGVGRPKSKLNMSRCLHVNNTRLPCSSAALSLSLTTTHPLPSALPPPLLPAHRPPIVLIGLFSRRRLNLIFSLFPPRTGERCRH